MRRKSARLGCYPIPSCEFFRYTKQANTDCCFAHIGCIGNPSDDGPSIKYSIGTVISPGGKPCTAAAAYMQLTTADILAYIRCLGRTTFLIGAGTWSGQDTEPCRTHRLPQKETKAEHCLLSPRRQSCGLSAPVDPSGCTVHKKQGGFQQCYVES